MFKDNKARRLKVYLGQLPGVSRRTESKCEILRKFFFVFVFKIQGFRAQQNLMTRQVG